MSSSFIFILLLLACFGNPRLMEACSCFNLYQLLETMVKNCGDIVHMHVAEKHILHEMVTIVRKKVSTVSRITLFIMYFFLCP